MADVREKDLILPPGEFVFALDTTKGAINVIVGPYQQAISGNSIPLLWRNERFERMQTFEEVTQRYVVVTEGEYVQLANPSASPNNLHPKDATSNNLVDLNMGRRIVIPGPAYFPLWPRQTHRVIPGHQLRSNQYLLVRVYNDEEALANWDKAVIKEAEGGADEVSATAKPAELFTGQLIIIKGTEISFYIPPTGIEVMTDADGDYVRDAVTLESMEFCILKGERGDKRYVPGPDVVFPSPTETFVIMGGEVKFKPVELTASSGLYVKVITDYKDGDEVNHREGDELFITGKQQAIYYPRPEHSIIKYGDRTVHHAVAVPRGEGRYVLNRETSEVKLVKGPVMLLPDPRTEVITRRVLDEAQVSLWYPGNTRALEVNRNLKADAGSNTAPASALAMQKMAESTQRLQAYAGDTMQRGSSFTPPRTITLETKYDGAVGVSPYPGYAVLVVNKSGDRRVIVGPSALLLEYDESLMPLKLSTGKPKTNNKTIDTVYLKTESNRVSDIVNVETRDLVHVQVTLAYRVNFEGEGADMLKWFAVDDYVYMLAEHARSILRGVVKQLGIEEFYSEPTVVIRNAILGASQENSERRGLFFKENGMRVVDVDVLDVKINDPEIATLIEEQQVATFRDHLRVGAKERELEVVRRMEVVNREIADERAKTGEADAAHELAQIKRTLEKRLKSILAESEAASVTLKAKADEQGTLDAIHMAELARKEQAQGLEIETERKRLAMVLEKMAAETKELVERSGAVNDKLIAALQAFSDKALLEKVAEAMAPLSILRDESVSETFANLIKGMPHLAIFKDVFKGVASPAQS